MDTVSASVDPVPHSKGIEGHGQGTLYNGSYYYYRVGRNIPLDRVSSLRSEESYMGRVHGEISHIVVVWNGENFTVLDFVGRGDRSVQKVLRKYRGLSAQQSIEMAEQQEKAHQDRLAAMPKCKCGRSAIVLIDRQHKDECMDCAKKRMSEKQEVNHAKQHHRHRS